MKSITALSLVSLILIAFATIGADTPVKNKPAKSTLPQGSGMAKQYPGDKGIEKDKRVLFAENFNAQSFDEVLKRWSDRRNPKESPMKLIDDGPAGAADRKAIQITAIPSKNVGGLLYKKFSRGVDQYFARFYVKFPKENHGYIHHFVHLGGYQPATNWAQGGAGERPKGNDRITVGIEPFGFNGRAKAPGLWNFYAYWHEMKVSTRNKYWGNSLQPIADQPVPVDRWQCVEVMIKLNTPGKRDGELALWLDGQLIMHIKKGVRRGRWSGMGFKMLASGGEPFEGFNFRTTEDLKLNFFWLLHYVTPSALKRNNVTDMDKPNIVLFDQIVVATQYIGPIATERKAAKDAK